MIIYKDVLAQLKKAGYSTYRIRKEKLLSEYVLTSLRLGRPVNTETINEICRLLNCQPGDIMEYVPDTTRGDV